MEKIDQMLEQGHIARGGKYKQIVVRVIELSRSRFSRSLGTASKLNRDPRFILDLMSHGEARAEEFLTALAFEDAWKSGNPTTVMDFFADDATLQVAAPFPGAGRYTGRAQVGSFVTKHLAGEVRIDLTKKQVAHNGVAWSVRTAAGEGSTDRTAPRPAGVAEAVFRAGRIRSLRLGTGA